jgi:hypothetical protein
LKDQQAKRNWLQSAVLKRTKELQILNENLKNLAKKDSLIGILNPGNFFEAARHILIRS